MVIFLKGRKDREGHVIQLVISDDHFSLGTAHKAVSGSIHQFAHSTWQRFQFHLQQNTGVYLPYQPCAWRWPQKFKPCSMLWTVRLPRDTCMKPFASTQSPLLDCQHEWRITSRKALRCMTFPWNICVRLEPQTVWSVSIGRFRCRTRMVGVFRTMYLVSD